MEAKELRIGNYVDLYGNAAQIHRTDFSKNEHGIAVEEGKPIALTSEWLVKLGFVYNPKYTYENVYEFKNIQLAYSNTEGWYLGNEETELEIKYIHQLQNLYFALTQEELTL